MGILDVNASAVDLEKYPRIIDAPYYEANVEEGDCVYIPQMWWHQVYSRLVSLCKVCLRKYESCVMSQIIIILEYLYRIAHQLETFCKNVFTVINEVLFM